MRDKPRIGGCKFWPFLALAIVLLAFPAFARPAKSAGQAAQAAAAAPVASPDTSKQENQRPKGLGNFGEVAPGLYRGGQPNREGYSELKKLGFTTVVTFRGERKLNAKEKQALESEGMHFVVIPWSAFHHPSDEQVAEFLQLVRTHSGQKVYLHCVRGGDRTGVMVATYRIAIDKWQPQQAVKEMEEYHFWHHMFPHLRAYVMNFPKLLGESPKLHAALISEASATQ